MEAEMNKDHVPLRSGEKQIITKDGCNERIPWKPGAYPPRINLPGSGVSHATFTCQLDLQWSKTPPPLQNWLNEQKKHEPWNNISRLQNDEVCNYHVTDKYRERAGGSSIKPCFPCLEADDDIPWTQGYTPLDMNERSERGDDILFSHLGLAAGALPIVSSEAITEGADEEAFVEEVDSSDENELHVNETETDVKKDDTN